MKNSTKALSAALLLVTVLALAMFYTGIEPASSQQPQGAGLSNQTFDPDFYTLEDLSPNTGFVVAAASCGSETCSADQCCCLNTDTGAQCCRPNTEGNCVASCKKSSPC